MLFCTNQTRSIQSLGHNDDDEEEEEGEKDFDDDDHDEDGDDMLLLMMMYMNEYQMCAILPTIRCDAVAPRKGK